MNSLPYSKLARIYDRVMAHVDYTMWTAYIMHIIKKSGLKVDRIIDISCGTGKHLQKLRMGEFQTYGSDISLPMLKEACKNTDRTFLFMQNACNLAVKDQSFDTVLMLYDSINYLLSEDEILNLLAEVKRILRQEGIFIFDFITQEGLRDCFEDYYESNSWGGLAYERLSRYSFSDNIQTNEFLFLYNGQSYKEVHKQKIRSITDWEIFIEKSNMKLLAKFSNFSLKPASEKSERVHFICQVK